MSSIEFEFVVLLGVPLFRTSEGDRQEIHWNQRKVCVNSRSASSISMHSRNYVMVNEVYDEDLYERFDTVFAKQETISHRKTVDNLILHQYLRKSDIIDCKIYRIVDHLD